MKTLIGMTDFVLKQEETLGREDSVGFKGFTSNVSKYANFLKQPNEKWMFVPCDLDGNVLEFKKSPYEYFCDKYNVCRVFSKEEIKYQEAKERCLFERFEIILLENTKNEYRIFKDNICILTTINSNNKTIEDLVKYNLQLTETAQKQLGWI